MGSDRNYILETRKLPVPFVLFVLLESAVYKMISVPTTLPLPLAIQAPLKSSLSQKASFIK